VLAGEASRGGRFGRGGEGVIEICSNHFGPHAFLDLFPQLIRNPLYLPQVFFSLSLDSDFNFNFIFNLKFKPGPILFTVDQHLFVDSFLSDGVSMIILPREL
jgi:hypothetical protein